MTDKKPTPKPVSVNTDQYKKLLDEGLITQHEYDLLVANAPSLAGFLPAAPVKPKPKRKFGKDEIPPADFDALQKLGLPPEDVQKLQDEVNSNSKVRDLFTSLINHEVTHGEATEYLKLFDDLGIEPPTNDAYDFADRINKANAYKPPDASAGAFGRAVKAPVGAVLFKNSDGTLYTIANTYDPQTGAFVLAATPTADAKGNPVTENAKAIGDAYISVDKNGKPFITSKFEAANAYIKNLSHSEFVTLRHEMIQRGYNINLTTDQRSDDFVKATAQVLDVVNRNNFDQFAANVNDKGVVQFDKIDKNKTIFDPHKALFNQEFDPRIIAAKNRAVTELKALAFANGLSYDDATINNWASTVSESGGTVDTYANQMRKAAAVAFPHFKDQLAAGANLTDIATSYIQTASHLLEVPEQSFDLSKPNDVVRKALSVSNDKGVTSPMNMNDFEYSVKSDPRWMTTKNAQETFASLYDNFAKMLGVGTHGA